MRKLLLSLCLTLFAATIMAVPAKRGIYRTLRLANGTEVRAQLCGDEHIHFSVLTTAPAMWPTATAPTPLPT